MVQHRAKHARAAAKRKEYTDCSIHGDQRKVYRAVRSLVGSVAQLHHDGGADICGDGGRKLSGYHLPYGHDEFKCDGERRRNRLFFDF